MDTNSQDLVLDNRFQLIVKIGNGSFGSIFRALDLDTKDYVAVKIEKQRKNKSQNDMIYWEVQILNLLEHEEGYPKLFGYGMIQNYKWMAVTLYGMNLEQLNKKKERKGIGLEETISIAT